MIVSAARWLGIGYRGCSGELIPFKKYIRLLMVDGTLQERLQVPKGCLGVGCCVFVVGFMPGFVCLDGGVLAGRVVFWLMLEEYEN